jgi:hypothetical protein
MLIYVAILPMNELSMLKEIKTPNMFGNFNMFFGWFVNELFFVSIVVAVQTYSIHGAF